MSHTPIYDQLREAPPGEMTTPLAPPAQATVRLVVQNAHVSKVNDISGRRGLGGRHRRSA
jgi:hypothetical protein